MQFVASAIEPSPPSLTPDQGSVWFITPQAGEAQLAVEIGGKFFGIDAFYIIHTTVVRWLSEAFIKVLVLVGEPIIPDHGSHCIVLLFRCLVVLIAYGRNSHFPMLHCRL